VLCFVIASVTGCATAAPPPVIPEITWEEKLAWILRLEDQRLLRDPNPPAPIVLVPATRRQPAILGPLPPSDLIRLLSDDEARVRRRSALALGRVRLPAAVRPLESLLADPESEVRQMAAFALGLIGDTAARPALRAALEDLEPIVQGRAAEALGRLGDPADAIAVSAMVQAHIRAGALSGPQPDDLSYPLAPATEAVRLGIYALTRLGAFEPLAAAVLDAGGQPVSAWWPVAYGLQRTADPRAIPALMTLLNTPGRYTASFAVRGLAATRAVQATASLRQIVERPSSHPAVVVQAIRALGAVGDVAARHALEAIVTDLQADANLRIEAMRALGAITGPDQIDLLLDFVIDPSPHVRGEVMGALARIDPDAFMAVLSGLEPDRDWIVRAAIAGALTAVPAQRSLARLTAMLADSDPRVRPHVMTALAALKVRDVEPMILDGLRAEDFATRAAAARAAADLNVPAAAPALVEMYRDGLGDSTYVARAAALAALHHLDTVAARPLLELALRDRDWAVRVRAAALLREQGVAEDPADAIRPASTTHLVDRESWEFIVAPPFSPRAFIDTNVGTIEIELAITDAPMTVHNFMRLARGGLFNGVPAHRVVADFVVQTGDPRGDGEGGPGYTIRDEINQQPYLRGTVGMALDWEDTGGSQFFITHSPQPHLDGRYTVFGHVVNGLDVVDRITPSDTIQRVRVWDGISPP
jgi:HEAT repeat protein/cyclophilin family peptidyl-prolyl cis-trans isomerase